MNTNHQRATSARRRLTVAVTVLVSLGLAAAGSPVASAAEPNLTAAESAELAQEMADSVQPVEVADIAPTRSGDLVAGAGTDAPVAIPRSPDEPTTMGSGEASISVAVPGSTIAKDARVVGDTVIYEGAAKGVDVAVQATAAGAARQMITIASYDSPRSYTFPVDMPEGAALRLNAGGAAEIVRGDEVLGVVDAPWAKDANGNDIATHYTIDGSSLTQHIAITDETPLPATADPLWIAGWVLYIVGSRCGIGAGGAMLLYRLSTERRSMGGYFTNAAIGCVTGGLGIRRY